MKKRYFYLLGFALLLFSQLLYAQGLVSVNNFTGTANVSIPLFNVTSGSLSAPVSLVYDGGGVKVKDVEGLGGMGWNLNAGGGVYRTVRGLPDDIRKDNAGNDRLGWLYNDKGSKIAGFSIANTTGPDSTHETHDAGYINTNFNDLSDTEPDIYNVSAPGLSCQLVFDASHHVKIMPYRDYKVSFVKNSDSLITSFTIVNDQGVSYFFDARETESRKLVAGPSGVSYFVKEYSQYQNGISYTTAWRLSSMMDLHGNPIYFSYIDNAYSRNTPLNLAIGGFGTATTLFTVKESFDKKLIDNIDSDDDLGTTVARFAYMDYKRIGRILSGVTAYGTGQSLSYIPVTYHGATDYTRWFLNTLYSSDKTYKFSYKGLYKVADKSYINLPDSTSKKVDLWGYYKGGSATSLLPQVYINPTDTTLERYRSLSPGTHSSSYPYTLYGADRGVNPDSIKTGVLDTVFYSKAAYANLTTNGYTVIQYESNDYYDPTAGSVKQGGGLRAQQVKDFNGSTTSPIDTHNYTYLTPGTSTTSGKPQTMPVYVFTEPIEVTTPPDDPWDVYTVRSESDLSPNSTAVIYGAVKVSQPGAGSTVYEYSTPGVFYESSHPSDWQPTTTYVARGSGFTKYFYAATGKNVYPFPNNANYSFQRGLLTKVSSYNSGGDEVSESTYTYQRTNSSPTVVTGLKSEINGNVYSYAKYNINTVIDNLTAQVSSKVFDLGSTTAYKKDTVNYYYTSNYHKLLTQQKNTNSDGTTNRTNIKYVKDYTASSNSDSTNTAIYHLQQLNLNYPIETYSQVERGGTNRTIAASLVKYRAFDLGGGYNIYMPAQKLKFVSGAGVTGFSPSAVSSGVFTYYSGYIPYENDLIYDYVGNLQTANDNNRNVGTSFVDVTTQLPLVNIANASANEVLFNRPASYLDRNPYANYYIFSARIKGDGSGVTTVSLSDGGHTHNYTITYDASTDYKYYSRRIPLTDMVGNFRCSYYNSGTPIMSEVLFYPDVAQVSTYNYNEAHQKISETNTNGKSVFYDYDAGNRLSHMYDNEHNIVLRKSYVIQNDTTGNDMGNGIITATPRTTPTVTLNAGFAKMTNLTGAVYTWSFGDGSPSVISTEALGEVTHTFPRVDSFMVSVTATSPYYNTKTVGQKVSSAGTPANIGLSTVNLDNGTGTITTLLFMRPDGSTVRYAWGQTILETGDIKLDHDVYKVIIGVKGQPYDPDTGLGFGSVTLSVGGVAVACGQYHAKEGSYIFNCDLTNPAISSVDITVSTGTCSSTVQ